MPTLSGKSLARGHRHPGVITRPAARRKRTSEGKGRDPHTVPGGSDLDKDFETLGRYRKRKNETMCVYVGKVV